MTILVTGGAGFIGANFVYYLLKEHPTERVVCVDCLTYAGNLSTLDAACKQPNFVFYKENICNRPAIFEIFEQEHPDIVVNFAAESHVDRSIESPEIFLQTNILGTQVMMDACRQYGVQRYHQVSTDEVYGDLPLDRPDLLFTEKPPYMPPAPTVPPKHRQIYWLGPTTAHLASLQLFRAAPTTMVHISSLKN